MKTLVYFASGPYKIEYESLAFEQIYLIDNCFKTEIFEIGKVKCLAMDCLKAVDYLKRNGVIIDCFVSLNEGLYEGGGSYAINSDMFLGYVMPILNDEYYHIMNKSYYCGNYKVSMNLPYEKTEIFSDNINYLDFSIFSKEAYHLGRAKMFKMIKNRFVTSLLIRNDLKVSVIQDSIWNDFDNLDLLILGTNSENKFFVPKKSEKIISNKGKKISEILEFADYNKYTSIGFTPWLKGNYSDVIEILNNFNSGYLKEVRFYHLNKNDYLQIKYWQKEQYREFCENK